MSNHHTKRMAVPVHDDRDPPVFGEMFFQTGRFHARGDPHERFLHAITIQALSVSWTTSGITKSPTPACKRAAATELSLHAAREFLYAFVFVALAWYEWRGAGRCSSRSGCCRIVITITTSSSKIARAGSAVGGVLHTYWRSTTGWH